MTKRLYYKDSYLKSFTTKRVLQAKDESGNWFVTLQETAFYPTGGGQPSDKGTLNGISVINVEEVEGEIRHYVSAPLEGEIVEGEIDWERRFDHMQQHAGQHILSAAFVEKVGFETVSFHLGQEIVTIDVQTNQLTEEQAFEVEKLANAIILENRPIETKWVTETEALNYPLRKKLSVLDNIRLVIIPDFDYNGCGGTHPSSTGQVSAIKILGWEKHKNYTRIEFVCGNRVRTQLHTKNKIVTELGKQLSSSESEINAAVKRLLDNGKAMEKSIEELREQLLYFEANERLANQQDGYVYEVFRNRSMQELQKLARIVTTKNETMKAIFISENEGKIQIVVARGKETAGNMKMLLGSILPFINGKGGGNEMMAQGGGDISNMTGEKLLQHTLNQAKKAL